MTIAIDLLRSSADLAAYEALQVEVLGDESPAVLRLPALRAVADSGGLLLGAREADASDVLIGGLVDLSASFEGFSALVNYARLVAAGARRRGVGRALLVAERGWALRAGVRIVRGWVDPLSSVESHLMWTCAGAIGIQYDRSILGELADRVHRGLATDRVGYEWWLESPRTAAAVEGHGTPRASVALHQMAVVTKTKPRPEGHRVLIDRTLDPASTHVLAEIPADLDALRAADLGAARDWRVGTREVFEALFATGYLLVGHLHEAGRSFQWFERVDRGDVLGRGPRGA